MGRSRSPLAVGLLAWLGVLGLVVRARLDVVLAATHPPDGASYDLPLLLTPSAVERIGEAVRAWASVSTEVPGVGIALTALVVDALAAALLLGATAIALRTLGGRLAGDGDPGRATIGRAALIASWFAIAAIVLRVLGDAGAWLLVHATEAAGVPGSLRLVGWALAFVEGAGLALAAAALGILGVAATWAALWRERPRGSVVRALITVRLHVLVVAFFGVLVLAPIIGPQLDDVILRWAQEPGDAVIAVVAMLWLGLVLLVACDHLLRHERDPPRNTSLRGMLVATAAVGALSILVPGLIVLAGIMLVLSGLSVFFRTIDDAPRRTGMAARRAPVANSRVPLVLAVAPVSMLGVAVVRAAAGEAAIGGGVFGWFVAGGILAPPLIGLLLGLPALRRTLRPVLIVSVLVSIVLVERIAANPWRWGDLLGVIGTFASFAVILSLLALAISRIDQYWQPPPVLLALGQRRLPILGILALWIAGSAVLLPDRGYHDVRVLELRAGTPARVDVAGAWRAWLRRNALRPAAAAGASRGPRHGVPLVLVAASGGGIRAAYWTARVVDCAIDRRGRRGCAGRSGGTGGVFAASGNSGGSVGLAAWAAHHVRGDGDPGGVWVDDRLGADYFAPAWAHTLFSDLPQSLLHIGNPPDRGAVLERAWEQSWTARQTSFASLLDGPPPSAGPLTQRMLDLPLDLPLLLFSGTSVTDGCRTNTSRLRGDALKEGSDRCGSPDPFTAGDGRRLSPRATFGATRDVFDACDSVDLRLSTAALLSARFPIISPAGRVNCGQADELRIVDGGYFDDSAASPLQELWARLAPLVDDFNRGAADRCVVPVMLQIDNAYVSTAPPSDASPPELVAPLSAIAKAYFAREAGAEQAMAIGFGRRRLDDGSLPTAGRRALERYVQIFPRAQPGTQAPLGWTLSQPSRDSLARQVESTPNARALREVRRWFSRSLRCEG